MSAFQCELYILTLMPPQMVSVTISVKIKGIKGPNVALNAS